jgi:hypothetical protein
MILIRVPGTINKTKNNFRRSKMKKVLSLIVVVLFLTNCEDSNVVGPVFDDHAEESFTAAKLADPNSSERQLVLTGSAKFDPENGSGGLLGKKTMYYPSTMSIGHKNHKVNIIRDVNPVSAVYKGGPKIKSGGKFRIVERTNNSRPGDVETVLFAGKYQVLFNSQNNIDEIVYWGNGKNDFLGSTLTASETLVFDENLYIKRNKLRKGISSPVFTSQLDGLIKKTILDAD